MEMVASACPVEGLILINHGGADLSRIVWDGLETQELKKAFTAQGISREDLALAWAICDPMHIGAACKVSSKRILLFTSKYDLIVPPACQETLWRSLNRPPRVELAWSHYGIMFHSRELQRRIIQFLQNLE
jgi:hypothetical protein